MSNKCDACGLTGKADEATFVRTTNGGLSLCRQCLDDVNRKSPLLRAAILDEREACAKVADELPHNDEFGMETRREIAAAIRARAGGRAKE